MYGILMFFSVEFAKCLEVLEVGTCMYNQESVDKFWSA